MLRLVWGPTDDGSYYTRKVPAVHLMGYLDSIEAEHGEINVTIVPARDYDADQAFDLHVAGEER